MRTYIKVLFVPVIAAGSIAAQALTLLDTGMTTLTSGDSLQNARLTRNSIVSDWSFSKAFPGITGTGTRHYHAYDVAVGLNNYVQVSTDDANASFFVSAYQTSYDGTNLALNYLGDQGASGNPFGNMSTFQVIGGLNSHVIVVVNEVNSGSGLGPNYRVLVEGFSDTEFGEAVPEPMTLSALSLAGLAALRRRSKRS